MYQHIMTYIYIYTQYCIYWNIIILRHLPLNVHVITSPILGDLLHAESLSPGDEGWSSWAKVSLGGKMEAH